jgi:magnesium chelatase family protein
MDSTKPVAINQPTEASISTLVPTAASEALHTRLLAVECTQIGGHVSLQLIGNATEVCRDGRERARAALELAGIKLPPKRLIINITPADMKKDGSHFDLPMAVSLMLLQQQSPPVNNPGRWLFAAELGLNGALRPVRGVVSFALAAMNHDLAGIIIAKENMEELSVLSSLCRRRGFQQTVLGFESLKDVLDWVQLGHQTFSTGSSSKGNEEPPHLRNFDDMMLESEGRLAALTIAGGMHSALLRGPPGTGKTMFAERIPSILPPMAQQCHIDALCIHSSQNERLSKSLLAGCPPYRSPHHQASAAAILGTPEKPGELSLAHGGVLFLDELPEFRRDLLESLREPLESGEITVSRAKAKVRWKGRILMLAAANNCPCGFNNSKRMSCLCATKAINAYNNRMSGPILDRIDLHLNMEERLDLSSHLLMAVRVKGGCAGQTDAMKEAVLEVRERQKVRNDAYGVLYNSQIPTSHLLACSGVGEKEFSRIVDRHLPQGLGNRAITRCLRVARTLADLRGQDKIGSEDLSQARKWQAEQAACDRGQQLRAHTVTV